MANASDIETVRRNVNEPTSATYSDTLLSSLVDSLGVAGASATVWREKAARYSELVDVSESGASHKYSDLHKNALTMAEKWSLLIEGPAGTAAGALKIRKIQRL